MMSIDEKGQFADLAIILLDWYAGAARELPWRIGPKARACGVQADPYRVWLAEIMLQQTTVAHATRYYRTFVETWPTLADLATAKDEDVMGAWAGLGYYTRARNLLKCARHIHAAGTWPGTPGGLRKLPGIGAYTAGALGALAFNWPVAAIDANVSRVFARLCAATGNPATIRKRIASLVQSLVPDDHPAEFAEALMDFGALICTPRKPDCPACPVQAMCTAYAEKAQDRYPVKPAKTARPTRHGHIYVMFGNNGDVLTEQRPATGLLGGMRGLPCSDWRPGKWPPSDVCSRDPGWQAAGEIRHVFTHFTLQAKVWRIEKKDRVKPPIKEPVQWCQNEQAIKEMPSLFTKALRLALARPTACSLVK